MMFPEGIFPLSVTALLIVVVIVGKLVGIFEKKRYHPIGGSIINQLMNHDRLHDYMTDLATKHKTYRLIAPFQGEVYTSDPANVEYILKTNFHNYGKSVWPSQKECLKHACTFILYRDGTTTALLRIYWEMEYSQLMVKNGGNRERFPAMNSLARAIRDVSATIFSKNAVKLAHIVSHSMASNQPMDIQDLFMKSTLDSIFRVAFGVDLDSICGSKEQGVKFCRAFDDASEIIVWRYVDVLWKIKKALNVGLEAKLKQDVRVIDEFVYKLIHSKIALMQDDGKEKDILSRFLKLPGANPKYLRDIILNFVMAGKDTIATTLSWFFYMMCKHPLLQERAAQEVREVTGSSGVVKVEDYVGCLSEEVVEKMHYLHAALTETLRLYPPVPLDPKMCFSDDTMPDGFHVKKGDSVSYMPYAMGRMRFVWGDDAEEFRPERWLDHNGCFRAESPFKFTAFQGGPRICLGKEFAYRQMKILSAVLLRLFVFRLNDEKKIVRYRTMINLHIDGGLTLRTFPRLQHDPIN